MPCIEIKPISLRNLEQIIQDLVSHRLLGLWVRILEHHDPELFRGHHDHDRYERPGLSRMRIGFLTLEDPALPTESVAHVSHKGCALAYYGPRPLQLPMAGFRNRASLRHHRA